MLMPLLSSIRNFQVRAAFYHIATAALDDHEGAIKDFNESIRLRPKKALYYQSWGFKRSTRTA